MPQRALLPAAAVLAALLLLGVPTAAGTEVETAPSSLARTVCFITNWAQVSGRRPKPVHTPHVQIWVHARTPAYQACACFHSNESRHHRQQGEQGGGSSPLPTYPPHPLG